MIRTLLLALCLLLPVVEIWGQSLRETPTYLRPTVSATPKTVRVSPTARDQTEDKGPGSEIPVGESLQQYITHLVIDEIPHEYENTKKWGGTKRVMSGLDWERDGLRIETRRQWKDANHGTWSRYKLKLIDPQQTFEIRLENLRDQGDNIAAFDLIGVARVDCWGRLSEWRRGVQLVSLSGEADAKVRLVAHVEVKMGLDPRTLPPDILLDPKVVTADLQLQEFELRRLSKADGPLVTQMGEVVEEGIQEYLAEHRQKLVDKMNAQIAKKRDRLRIPLSKLTTSAWGAWFEEFFQ